MKAKNPFDCAPRRDIVCIAKQRPKLVYRVFDMGDYEDRRPRTLFHGNKGSRRLDFNVWHEADMMPVTSGPNSTVYMSGWHVTESKEACWAYLRKFKNIDRKIVTPVFVAGEYWPKDHSPSPIFLTQFMMIHEVDYYTYGQAYSQYLDSL